MSVSLHGLPTQDHDRETRCSTARIRCVRSLGFTVLELLVAIAIIGVLIAISAPAIGAARTRARSIVCLSNLRQFGAIMTIYAAAHADSYPFAPAGTLLSQDPDGAGIGLASPSHWTLSQQWPSLFQDVAPWREFYPTWICPAAPRVRGSPWRSAIISEPGGTSYEYCYPFFARPENWAPVRPDPSVELLAPVRLGEVFFPSAKLLAFDFELAHLLPKDGRDVRPMLTADGAAAIRNMYSIRPPAINWTTGGARLLADTPDGVQGVDLP